MPIDRPAEDDTPRASPENPAADTPSAAEHETPDRVACALKYRETVDAAYREYQAAREWDEAVPLLREAWENHEKKWTYLERTGPTVHQEVPGAWREDGGRYLAPDANAEVAHGCARIREVGETVITPAMRRIEAEDPDRHLAGLEHHLKGEARLKEEVADELEARPGLTSAVTGYLMAEETLEAAQVVGKALGEPVAEFAWDRGVVGTRSPGRREPGQPGALIGPPSRMALDVAWR